MSFIQISGKAWFGPSWNGLMPGRVKIVLCLDCDRYHVRKGEDFLQYYAHNGVNCNTQHNKIMKQGYWICG